MKRFVPGLILAIALLLGTLDGAAAPIKVLDGVSAASGSSSVYDTSVARDINVQVCGTGFSGTVVVKQGESADALVTTYTWTLTTNSDCTNYRKLATSTYTQITYTRSAGSVTVYLGAIR